MSESRLWVGRRASARCFDSFASLVDMVVEWPLSDVRAGNLRSRPADRELWRMSGPGRHEGTDGAGRGGEETLGTRTTAALDTAANTECR